MVPFRRSAASAPLRGFVNETADVFEEPRSQVEDSEVIYYRSYTYKYQLYCVCMADTEYGFNAKFD